MHFPLSSTRNRRERTRRDCRWVGEFCAEGGAKKDHGVSAITRANDNVVVVVSNHPRRYEKRTPSDARARAFAFV